MLLHPTLDKMKSLKLYGLAQAWEEQEQNTEYLSLSFEERLGLMIDREYTDRENRRLQLRLRLARLRQSACLEEIDWRSRRGLDRNLFTTLTTCEWIRSHLHVLLTGPTGCGKTYLACALGQKACREGYRVEYQRLPRLLPDLAVAKGDGRYASILRRLAKLDLLLLDDFGLYALTPENRRDLLELVEDRSGHRSTLITSQLPLEHWHEAIGDPTLADAILDRLVHDAYKITLKGESLRKLKTPLRDPSDIGKLQDE
jgi:DNA replication protein DnaC